MSTVPVRICLVGLGWWGTEHARACNKVKQIDLTACFARHSETRRKVAEEYSCLPMESWEAVLKNDEIEAVLIATPHSTHARLVREAASAGKHVFVEKPFVLNVSEGQSAIAACERAGVRLAVGHQRRYQPAHRELKRLVEAGELGQIVQAEANFSYNFAFKLDLQSWRAKPEESPAGAMTGLGIHMADNLQYLLGPAKAVLASSRSVHPRTPLDDVTGVLLELESGAVAYLGTNMVTPKVFFIRLCGIEGNALAEDEGRSLLLQKKESEPVLRRFEVEGDPVTAPLTDELADFATAIRENRLPEVDGVAGLRASAVLEAITISAREGRKIEIADLYK